MPYETTLHHTFDNGLVLLGDKMPWLRSAAFAFMLPAGCRFESPDRLGLAGFVNEMIQRGAGNHSSRDLVAIQDNLGLDRSSSISTAHGSFGGSMPAESLPDALTLYADMVMRPHLPGDQIEDARLMCLQELQAAEDDLPQTMMNRLKQMHYGDVLGRNSLGDEAGLMAIDAADIRSFYQRRYQPCGAMLSVAGNFDWDVVRSHVETLFADWKPGDPISEEPVVGTAGYEHIEHPSQQTHLGIAFPAVRYGDPDYYPMRAAIGVLSDGMSSRLFTRVREERGLCYTISAGCHSMREGGGVFCYAGTTAERAQETLDVTLQELQGIADGIEESELERLKVRIQSSLIMEQESSASRASAIVSDWYLLGRVQSRDELQKKIDALTTADLVDYWKRNPPKDLRIVTVGPEPLKVP
ncbi:Peptidase M16 inactive domain protein [Rosistilla ulvae]|uniref:Peptidase M16 inactive domain protein n=1 Tax=Rosistilla ulvae TaxID=1930277 RepID=A0A517M1V2_9BACT|nr:pitrilysin family protein [Rosistilla ulvae]QDS88846.1 Peptidase M16 inactive domain protein [Rosistilla ulvae]